MDRSTYYRPEIDGLRALAVLAVIIFHLNSTTLPGGYLGVDVFFVLSGYLITRLINRNLQAGTFSFTGFYLRRVKRILPALYVLLFVVTLVAVVILLPTDLKDYGRSLVSQSVFAGNIYFYLKSDYFDTPSLLKPILHTWSLSAEEQFYIVYPLLTVAMFKFFGDKLKYILTTLFVIGVYVCYYTYNRDQSAAFYLLPSRAFELLLGGLFSFNFFNSKSLPPGLKQVLSAAGITGIVYSFVFFSKNTQLFGLGALLPALCTGFVIAGGGTTLTGKLLSAKPFNYTGKISYSLYLWHWPLLVFYVYAAGNSTGFLSAVVLLAISYALAILSYQFIEVPVRKSEFRPAVYFSCAVAGIVLFASAGYYFERKNGLPKRFSQNISKIFSEATREPDTAARLFYGRKGMRYTGTGAKPGILVWGDSHAGMLQPVLVMLTEKYGQTYAVYSCPAALNVFIANWDKSYAESPCYRSNQEIIDYIKNNHIKCILFASAWSQYTEGRELKMEGAGQQDKLYADSLTQRYSTEDSKRVFKSKMTYTINLLSKLDVAIWIMEQVPQQAFWVPNEVARRLAYHQDTLKIGRPLVEHEHRQQFVNGVFAEFAKNKKVHLLDPTPYFLSGTDFVTAYKNGKSLYFDYNHLSPAGARMLEPMFKPMFDSLR